MLDAGCDVGRMCEEEERKKRRWREVSRDFRCFLLSRVKTRSHNTHRPKRLGSGAHAKLNRPSECPPRQDPSFDDDISTTRRRISSRRVGAAALMLCDHSHIECVVERQKVVLCDEGQSRLHCERPLSRVPPLTSDLRQERQLVRAHWAFDDPA